MNIINVLETYMYRESRGMVAHYPSSCRMKIEGKIYGSCLRQSYWKWKNEPKSNVPQLENKLKMMFGNFVHNGLQNIFKNYEMTESIEQSAKKVVKGLEYKISYRTDGILYVSKEAQERLNNELGMGIADEDVNKRIGLEIKSKWGKGIDKLFEGKIEYDKQMQVVIYMVLENIDYFILFFLGQTGMHYQYDFRKVDNEIFCNGEKLSFTIADIFRGYKEVEDALKDTTKIPDREYFCFRKDGECQDQRQSKGIIYRAPWNCRFCDWRDLCWGGVRNNEIEDGYNLEQREAKKYPKAKKKTAVKKVKKEVK